MVLSNKKLKQKLRAEKTELLAASESQSNSTTINFNNPEGKDLQNQKSLQSLLKTVTQKPRLSKREKRREKAQSLPEKAKTSGQSDGGDVKKEEDGDEEKGVVGESKKEKKKKKRKRGEDEGLENAEGKEVEEVTKAKNSKKKKKKKNKKKGKKKLENGEVGKEATKSEFGGIEEQGVVEASNVSESKENLELCTKVYVGGIPYYSTEDDIRSYFEGCGTITEIDCMRFPETGKFRGIAIITFKTEAATKRALALDGSDMGGLYLKIQPYKSSRVSKTTPFAPAIVEGYNRIYVGNLSWEITEDDLRKLFSHFTITSIRFGEDKETGEFKGYAHVDFADSVSVNLAIKLDQQIVCGRPIRISCAVAKKGAVTSSNSLQQNNVQANSIEMKPLHQNSVQENSTEMKPLDQISVQVNSNEVSSISAKIRRRTCYECGERGHLSSSCPNKQATDQANPVAS